MVSNSESCDDPGSPHVPLGEALAGTAQLDQCIEVLFETSPAAMCIVSALDNRYLRVNQAMADLYGRSVEEILNSDPYSLALKFTHPDDLVAEQRLFAQLAAGTRPSYRIEKRYVRPDGSVRWGLLTFSGIFEESAVGSEPRGMLFAVGQVIDITERKLLAETLEQREAELRHAQKIDGIGRLAAGVAHDFNNLLTVIMGHAEVLQRSVGHSLPDDAQADIAAVLAAAERAASLTAQLLAHGRAGQTTPRTLVLSEAVATLQRLVARTLERSIQLEQSLLATGCVLADEGEITQIAMNLVLNARDALAEGGRIRVSTEDIPSGALPGSGEWVALVVSDTGHGMSPEVQARMFEPFFTTRTDRPGTQGTGLGLATVQRIVAGLGGRIEVQSAPGQGTAITVLLPRVAHTPQESVRPALARRVTAAPNSRRVLVVEDEPTVRSLIGRVLLGAHYWVMVARDGEEALRFIAAEQEPFHLIVTDLMMPRMGGMSVAQRLQRLHEQAGAPRMLFVSGYSSHARAELGPYGDFLPKPFTGSELLSAVSRALDGVS